MSSSFPPSRRKKVEDPTGAGDSFRGGLISGLVRGKDIEESARMGSVCASFAVECYGTQEYTFTPREFNERFNRSFGQVPVLEAAEKTEKCRFEREFKIFSVTHLGEANGCKFNV